MQHLSLESVHFAVGCGEYIFVPSDKSEHEELQVPPTPAHDVPVTTFPPLLIKRTDKITRTRSAIAAIIITLILIP